MPIKIPNSLPARRTLEGENIFVMTETRARTQDMRPLRIALLNLMPTKIATETQLSRLLGNTPLQVELTLVQVESHVSKNTPEEHMLAFYKPFGAIADENFDGMVITGAPVENMEFEEVEYWDELCRPSLVPEMKWRGHANLLYSNWLNYFVYQTTPYDLSELNEKSEAFPGPEI